MTAIRVGGVLINPELFAYALYGAEVAGSRPLLVMFKGDTRQLKLRGVTIDELQHALNWSAPVRDWQPPAATSTLPPTPDGFDLVTPEQEWLDLWAQGWSSLPRASRVEGACGAAPNVEWIRRMAKSDITTSTTCVLVKSHEGPHILAVAHHGAQLGQPFAMTSLFSITPEDAA